MLLKLARKSLINRKATTFLTAISISMSVILLLGIERIKTGTRSSFESTVSGVDLIVGARSGPVNLLLYSVFRIGNATNNISYETYQKIIANPRVEWSVPISLGDSHRGFRVVGTTEEYFKYYKYAGTKHLSFAEGRKFQDLFDVVLGSDVAREFNYKIGKKIVLSHGATEVSFQKHEDKPFVVTGILKKTGTPVDKSVHVSLKAITALHVDWTSGAPPRPGENISAAKAEAMNLEPSDVTAFFLKLKSKIAIFNVQRGINQFEDEPLMAIIPGLTLRELWGTISIIENALVLVSILVFIVSLLSMIISLLSTLNERRREMSIYRSLGAKKEFIFSMLIVETLILAFGGIIVGLSSLYGVLLILRPVLESEMGLTVGLLMPTMMDAFYIVFIIVGSILAGIIPSIKAYRNTLADGLTIKS